MTSPLTTHALDTSSGKPACGLQVRLFRQLDDGTEDEIMKTVCDENGRISDLIEKNNWKSADYRIRFFTRDYFAANNKECFYPHCDVTFTVADTKSHYHVPLLISPYGFTTYRGS